MLERPIEAGLSADPPRLDFTARFEGLSASRPPEFGEPLRLLLQARLPRGGDLRLPETLDSAGFDIRGVEMSDTLRGDSLLRSFRFDLAPLDTGLLAFPPQPFRYRHAGDTAVWTLASPEAPLRVVSALPPGTETLADIRPPVELGRGALFWTLGGFLLLAHALLLFFLLRPGSWLRRKVGGRAPSAPLSPGEEAKRALAALAAEALLEKGESRIFAFRLSDILRRFLDRRFRCGCLEWTTAEFETRLAPLPLEADWKTRVVEILARLDPVKFAALPLPVSEGNLLFKQTEALVLAYDPADAPAAEASSGSGKHSAASSSLAGARSPEPQAGPGASSEEMPAAAGPRRLPDSTRVFPSDRVRNPKDTGDGRP